VTAIRFFTDEDVQAAIALALRQAGIDAISTLEANRLRSPDREQLEWAHAEGRVLISYNVSHFAQLHRAWLASGRHHSGLVVSTQRPIGEAVKRILKLAQTFSREEMLDRLEFLSQWRP
jgi:hypothetical protein